MRQEAIPGSGSGGYPQQNITDAIVRADHSLASQKGSYTTPVRNALKDAYFVASVSKEVERSYRQRLGSELSQDLHAR